MRNTGRTVQLLRASSVSIACTYLVYLVVFPEEEKVKKAATYTRLMMSQPHASVWTQALLPWGLPVGCSQTVAGAGAT